MPGISEADVFAIIERGGVTVSSGLKAADRWQKREFRVFWCNGAGWVAIVDLATGAILSVIPAWDDERDLGVGLFELVGGEKTLVAYVKAHHIRRAIRARDGIEVPERFLPRKYTVSARILFRSGKLKVVRLDRIEGLRSEVVSALADADAVAAWRQKMFDLVGGEEIREAMLSVSGGQYEQPIETPLVESPTVGGWGD